jgi:hypothetical protein
VALGRSSAAPLLLGGGGAYLLDPAAAANAAAAAAAAAPQPRAVRTRVQDAARCPASFLYDRSLDCIRLHTLAHACIRLHSLACACMRLQHRLHPVAASIAYGCRRAAPRRRPAWRSTRATRHCTQRATAGRRSTAQVLGRRARRRCRQARAWWATAKGVTCACPGAPATRPSVRRSCGHRATRAASFGPTTRRRPRTN